MILEIHEYNFLPFFSVVEESCKGTVATSTHVATRKHTTVSSIGYRYTPKRRSNVLDVETASPVLWKTNSFLGFHSAVKLTANSPPSIQKRAGIQPTSCGVADERIITKSAMSLKI